MQKADEDFSSTMQRRKSEVSRLSERQKQLESDLSNDLNAVQSVGRRASKYDNF